MGDVRPCGYFRLTERGSSAFQRNQAKIFQFTASNDYDGPPELLEGAEAPTLKVQRRKMSAIQWRKCMMDNRRLAEGGHPTKLGGCEDSSTDIVIQDNEVRIEGQLMCFLICLSQSSCPYLMRNYSTCIFQPLCRKLGLFVSFRSRIPKSPGGYIRLFIALMLVFPSQL